VKKLLIALLLIACLLMTTAATAAASETAGVVRACDRLNTANGGGSWVFIAIDWVECMGASALGWVM